MLETTYLTNSEEESNVHESLKNMNNVTECHSQSQCGVQYTLYAVLEVIRVVDC